MCTFISSGGKVCSSYANLKNVIPEVGNHWPPDGPEIETLLFYTLAQVGGIYDCRIVATMCRVKFHGTCNRVKAIDRGTYGCQPIFIPHKDASLRCPNHLFCPILFQIEFSKCCHGKGVDHILQTAPWNLLVVGVSSLPGGGDSPHGRSFPTSFMSFRLTWRMETQTLHFYFLLIFMIWYAFSQIKHVSTFRYWFSIAFLCEISLVLYYIFLQVSLNFRKAYLLHSFWRINYNFQTVNMI